MHVANYHLKVGGNTKMTANATDYDDDFLEDYAEEDYEQDYSDDYEDDPEHENLQETDFSLMLLREVQASVCPNDCSDVGVCDNGTCICNDGKYKDNHMYTVGVWRGNYTPPPPPTSKLIKKSCRQNMLIFIL